MFTSRILPSNVPTSSPLQLGRLAQKVWRWTGSRPSTAPRMIQSPGFRQITRKMKRVIGIPVGRYRPVGVKPMTLSAYITEADGPKVELIKQGSLPTFPNFGFAAIMNRRRRWLRTTPSRVPVRGWAQRAKLNTAKKLAIIPSGYRAKLPGFLTRIETIGFTDQPVGSTVKGGGNDQWRQHGFLQSRLCG